jgi:hypothetical protein
MKVATAWLNNNDARCQLAQRRMLRSVLDLGLEPVIVNGSPRPLLSAMLKQARDLSPAGGHFMWLNSDCEIIREEFPAPHEANVIGLHRIESADGSVCPGVDGYIIPCETWDRYYAADVPAMYCGGTHVDWWLTRLAQARGCYTATVSLHHISHGRSGASTGRDAYGEHNLVAFHEWAQRNGIPTEYEA